MPRMRYQGADRSSTIYAVATIYGGRPIGLRSQPYRTELAIRHPATRSVCSAHAQKQRLEVAVLDKAGQGRVIEAGAEVCYELRLAVYPRQAGAHHIFEFVARDRPGARAREQQAVRRHH